MIYDTALILSPDTAWFIGRVQEAVDGFQRDNLEVEVQYAPVPGSYTTLIIARKP